MKNIFQALCIITFIGSNSVYSMEENIDQSRQVQTLSEADKIKSLFESAKSGNTNMLRLLLATGANVNQQGKYGETPLHVASKNGHIDTVQLLIDNKADINQKSKFEGSPLTATTSIDTARLLINSGADVYEEDCVGSTILHTAARNGWTDIVKLLINKGAYVNNTTEKIEGGCWKSPLEETVFSPLYLAAENGHLEVVKLLINADPNINQTDAIDIASKNGHTVIVELLKINNSTALHL